jgi:hypothetical protein
VIVPARPMKRVPPLKKFYFLFSKKPTKNVLNYRLLWPSSGRQQYQSSSNEVQLASTLSASIGHYRSWNSACAMIWVSIFRHPCQVLYIQLPHLIWRTLFFLSGLIAFCNQTLQCIPPIADQNLYHGVAYFLDINGWTDRTLYLFSYQPQVIAVALAISLIKHQPPANTHLIEWRCSINHIGLSFSDKITYHHDSHFNPLRTNLENRFFPLKWLNRKN